MPTYVADLDTPAVIVDLDRLEANIERMQALMNRFGLGFRPHVKAHKIPEIAQMQMRAGAIGITCQKIGEAEVMANAGLKNILLSYNIVGASKLDRLTRLAKRSDLIAAVDSEYTVAGIAQAACAANVEVKLVIELDTGDRAGVQSAAAAVALGQRIQAYEGVRLVGLMAFPTPPEKAPFIAEVVSSFRQRGLPLEIVSGGGSVPALTAGQVPGLTEHRAGAYVYGDRYCVRNRLNTWEDCAQRVVCTVVSRPTANRAIIDAGSKTTTNDGGAPFGYLMEYPEADFYLQSEEHGHIDLSRCTRKPEIGEQITFVPNHTCACTNLHDQVFGVRNGVVEVVWDVAARGKIR
jgi:D-serine deaminase-like pyridoxal phosphate-dependent protein